MWGLIEGGLRRVLHMDWITHALMNISVEHERIHEGRHFFICGETVLGAAGTIDFQLTAPVVGGREVHMTFQYESTQEIALQIFEGAVVDADGTLVTAENNNRNSGNGSDIQLLQIDGTITKQGNPIYAQRSGVAGNVNQQSQGVGQRDKEIILKQNTTTRFLFTSGGAANNFSYCGEFYEVRPKN